MLRRVVRASRILLLTLGVSLLVLIPVSFQVRAYASSPVPAGAAVFVVKDGAALLFYFDRRGTNDFDFTVTLRPADVQPRADMWAMPSFERSELWQGTKVRLPLWLLAAVCLAWPVTSFLVRRRRRGRGFEVERKAAGDPVTASGS